MFTLSVVLHVRRKPVLYRLGGVDATGRVGPARLRTPHAPDASRVDYKTLYELRFPLLRRAFADGEPTNDSNYRRFCEDNAHWLGDYALFMALKNRFDGKPWTEWPEALRLRRRDALERARAELSEEIAF